MLRLEASVSVCVILFALWTGAAAQHTPEETGGASTDQAASRASGSEARSILIRAIQLHQAGDFDEAIHEYEKYLGLEIPIHIVRSGKPRVAVLEVRLLPEGCFKMRDSKPRRTLEAVVNPEEKLCPR